MNWYAIGWFIVGLYFWIVFLKKVRVKIEIKQEDKKLKSNDDVPFFWFCIYRMLKRKN